MLLELIGAPSNVANNRARVQEIILEKGRDQMLAMGRKLCSTRTQGGIYGATACQRRSSMQMCSLPQRTKVKADEGHRVARHTKCSTAETAGQLPELKYEGARIGANVQDTRTHTLSSTAVATVANLGREGLPPQRKSSISHFSRIGSSVHSARDPDNCPSTSSTAWASQVDASGPAQAYVGQDVARTARTHPSFAWMPIH
eukprot:6213678-Pleurochrysis_carterae.AAC.6